ncbi:MAG: DegT/DnrJ/EryC1/StrS family aminotransferase [Coriobacteriales bacterium]|jgi:dTDP-4-amino-4,6-dideoxygalactose transaminase|nr:DegT/DnrJ/EryC1/StrS family aminotransferase [Coriobacteriales bacterium]
MRVEFSPPDITEAEVQAVADALRSGWITTGPRVARFEQELASWCGTSRVACLSSATAALECALHLLGIGPGDEVITSAYTYTASASVICHVGATPVLVDTAPGSYEMDYEALAAHVSTRTKAVIPVDVGGVMCDYGALFAALDAVRGRFAPTSGTLQEAFDRVVVIADGAHSFGASCQGRPSGAVADLTAFSFHAVKNLTTAEGGALTWRTRAGSGAADGATGAGGPVPADDFDSDELYHQVRLLALHGQDKDALAKSRQGAWEYDVLAPLYKCNMTDIAAALGLAQLERYPALLARRRTILKQYRESLPQDTLELLPHYTEKGTSSGHLCLTRLTGRDEAFRNRFIERMAAREVACNVHYKPLPLLTAYRRLGFDIRDFPHAFAQYANEVTLPLHTALTDAQVAYVVASVEASYRECVRSGV